MRSVLVLLSGKIFDIVDNHLKIRKIVTRKNWKFELENPSSY